MKFSDVFGNYTKIEQKLENILLYYDFLPNSKLPMILMKDGSIVVLFNIDGLDYEGLSEEQREDYSHYIRTAMELLPNEGAGFMFSNLLIRDTAKPIPLVRNSAAPELIRYVQGKKQKYWYELIKQSYSNRILCGLRYYPVERKEPGWQTCISERKVHKFYADQINSTANTLKQGYISFSSGLSRFKVRELSRQEVYASLYELINYATPGVYRPDLSLVEQLARSRYYFHSNDEYLVINDAEYISLVGVRRPPPVSVAMYLRRFYELGFPMIMRQSIGFINKTKLSEEHNRNLPIATSLSMIDSKNLIYVDEINEFRKCIDEDNDELLRMALGLTTPVVPGAPAQEAVPEIAEKTAIAEKPTQLIYTAHPPVVVNEGEMLEAALVNRLIVNVEPSPVVCALSRDLFDRSGKYVVFPANSHVLGTAQAVSYKGASRLFISFHKIILPNGLSLDLPQSSKMMRAMDETGAIGIVSHVNRHWMLQFGAAVMLGVFDGIAGLAQRNNQTTTADGMIIGRTSENFGRILDRVMDRYSSIMPTISVFQGKTMRIFISDDIVVSPYSLITDRSYYGIR